MCRLSNFSLMEIIRRINFVTATRCKYSGAVDPSTIVCNDFVGELSPTNLAVDINRNEYEYLKRW